MRHNRRYPEAIFNYKEALRIDPNHRGAHEYLGQAYVQTKQLDKAKEKLIADAGKAMVKSMVEDLTLSPEAKAARAVEDESKRRSRRKRVTFTTSTLALMWES